MPSLRFLALRLLALTALLVGWSSAHAQITNVDDTTSTPIPGAGHDYIHLLSETVNPSNGSVSLRIAFPMPKGRGVSLPFSMAYDSNSLHHLVPGFYPHYGTAGWQSNKSSLGQGGWSYSLPAAGLISTDVTEGSYPNYYTCTLFSNYIFHDPSGAPHALGLASYLSPNGPCAESPIASGGDGQVRASLGNNGWQYGFVTVFSADGTVYQFNSAGISNDDSAWSFPDYIEDRNGNKITHTANSFVDTLGRGVITWDTLLGSSTTPTNLTVGGLAYRISWKQTSSNFSVPNQWVGLTDGPNSQYDTCTGPSAIADTQPVISQITLPNGKSFTFYYGTDNPNPNYQNPYGLLSEIDYPDGGSVKYTWKLSDTYNELADYPGLIYQSPSSCGSSQPCPVPVQDGCLYQYRTPVVSSRTVAFSGGSTASLTQTFVYSTAWNATPSGYVGASTWASKSTNVTTTDGVTGNTALTTYNYLPVVLSLPPYSHTSIVPQAPVESAVLYYDWGRTTNPLRTVNKTWYDTFNIGSQQTILEDNSTSTKVVYCYAGTNCDPRYNAPPFPQVIKKDEYDFGASSPTRKTLTTYQAFSGTPGILGAFPCKVQTQNGSGTTIAESDYYYDGNTSLCAAISSGVAVGGPSGYSNHDGTTFSTSATTPRGNATKVVKKCLQSCTDATTTYTFDEAGSVLSQKDACGNASCTDMTGSSHTTTYSYVDNFDTAPTQSTYAYLTQITDPLGHVSKFKYALSDGQLIQSQDQNDITAGRAGNTYLYGDSLRRLTETDYPDGGKVTVSYSDTAPSPSVTTARVITSPSTSISTTSIMDGMGHVTQTQLTTDPDGATYTDTTYDGFGRVRTQSNPHRSTSTSTDGITTNYYDALGRPCLVVPPDGTLPSGNGCPASQPNNTIFTTYSGNTTTLTDQAGKARKTITDGLGRLITVFEDPQMRATKPTIRTIFSIIFYP
jgi:hypothetical protein